MKDTETIQAHEAPSETADGLAASNIGDYTLERVREHKPLELQTAITLLSEGIAERQVSRETGLSRNTITQITIQHEDEIAPLRIQSARQCRKVHTMATEIALEYMQRHQDPDDDFQLPVNMVPVYTGVYTEKELLQMGEATERKEVVEKPCFKSLKEIWDSLEGDEPMPIINVTPAPKDE